MMDAGAAPLSGLPVIQEFLLSIHTSRHIITNPGPMSDIAISKCLRAHHLHEAFRAGLAVVRYPQTMLRADFLEDWPLKCFELRVGGHYPGPGARARGTANEG